MGNPLKKLESAVRGAFGGGGNPFKRLEKNARSAIKNDPIKKLVEAPLRSLAAADPLYQRLKTGHWQSPNKLAAGGVHELYSADPLARNIGIREKDAVTAAKLAGAAAAIYFTAGAASSAFGSGTAASAAAVSGEAGGVASSAGVTAAGVAKTVGTVVGATSVAGQIYGTVQQRKMIAEAQEQAKADQLQVAEALADANQEAPVMPGPTSASINAARKRSLAEQQRRRGRSASILSDDSNQPLGS